ncbi:tetratricopeptide repeat protein [Alkalicoccobacillus gibsonii]|uniref:tetratricopeptide repeat protein n=1 Tax=Alkalicoccobacillus gibsonii TaxID=79881 RepID=UPI003F7C14FF
MKIYIKPLQDPIVAFHLVRVLISVINFQPKTALEKECVRLIDPLSELNFEADDYRSLTETQDYKSQLRFYTLDRVKRTLNSLVKAISEHLMRENEAITLIVCSKNKLDVGSSLFIDLFLANNVGNVLFKNEADENFPNMNNDQLEHKIKNIVLNSREKTIYDLTQKFLSVGNAWTAISLLEKLITRFGNNDEYFYDLGIAYTQIEKTETAEFYLEKSKSFGGINRIIDANYVLSMLYTRHHPKNLHSLEKAEMLLNEAYTYCDNEVGFHKVFNRNGYALILFRKGLVEEAINILIKGIQSLRESGLSSVDGELHESVLTYNLAQCYVSTEDYVKACSTFERLIDMDPHYPENHLEYAKYLIKENKYDKAVEHLNIAKSLNPNLPEVYSLLALYFLNYENNVPQAKENYQLSYKLSNYSSGYLYDLCYVYTLMDRYEECMDLLKDVDLDQFVFDKELYIDLTIIKVECFLNLDLFDDAKSLLAKAESLYPENETIKENQNLIATL